MSTIRVFIVDDSATMRSIIKSVLSKDAEIDVVGEAGDPYKARDKIKEVNPHVLILDIEMPRMSGLVFLEKVMTLRPMPVVMLSGSTKKGAKDTIQALSIGAFDCIEKPSSGDFLTELAGLPTIIKAAARHSVHGQKTVAQPDKAIAGLSYAPNKSIIGIGASTGGVEALTQILSAFPKNCPPTVITQHMPAAFMMSFAERLNALVLPEVAIARDGEALSKGRVLFAPGGENYLEIRGRAQPRCHLYAGGNVSGRRRYVDVMFNSMGCSIKTHAIGVILTGLGRDGAEGLLAMRQAGAKTIGQNEASCIVYGMPKVAMEKGAVEQELGLLDIGPQIVKMSNCNA